MTNLLNRGTGLLLIEVINSNPNGDPDRENDPRTRPDHRGEITSVSFKRKVRDLVLDKGTPIWKEFADELELAEHGFDILESRNTDRQHVEKLVRKGEFLETYWDARVFGTTFLESAKNEKESFIATGPVQFGVGISLNPIRIERMTNTKVMPVEEDKSKGMAPLAFRIVSYGLYAMPFFINATAAYKTKCTPKDIELLLRLIPFAYTESASYLRPQVNIRHAFYVEHTKPRGTFNEFQIIEALTPRSLIKTDEPAVSWNDYDEASLKSSIIDLNKRTAGKTLEVVDLIDRI